MAQLQGQPFQQRHTPAYPPQVDPRRIKAQQQDGENDHATQAKLDWTGLHSRILLGGV
jgi:hypothetical protein